MKSMPPSEWHLFLIFGKRTAKVATVRPEIARAHPRLPMLLISVQEVSKQFAWEARQAGYRGAVTKSSGDEVLKGIEALLRHEMFFYSDDGSSSPAHGNSS